ncbi:peptidoglycan D,D-transpeptidase FtsI family protein [candidate division KSB1 bacterium]
MKILSFLIHILIYIIIFFVLYRLIKSSARIYFKKQRILNLIYSGLFLLFVFLTVYMIYTEVMVSGQDFKTLKAVEDKRLWIKEKIINRGRILDRNNRVIAGNEKDGLYSSRYYLDRESFVHLVGFSSEKRKLRTGLEQTYNNWLNGEPEGFNFLWNWNLFKNMFFNLKAEGNDLKLTIDADLQSYLYDQFNLKPGSAVGINPRTGEILFIVSSPGYSEDLFSNKYDYLMENNCFLFRPVRGRFEPGSTFKVIVTAAAIENDFEDFTITDTKKGFTPPGSNRPIFNHNHEVFGLTGLKRALKKSSNVYFAQLGLQLGPEKVYEYAEKFFFNDELKINSGKNIFKIDRGVFPSIKELSPVNLAWASIGQSSIITTPFNMAVTASIIANEGKYCTPYIEMGKGKKEKRIIEKKTAEKIKWMMFEVVGNPVDGLTGPLNWEDRENYGTGYNARVRGVLLAGKTGTAENPHGEAHSWFIGFAPADDPVIAFAVLLEHAGTGGEGAAKFTKNLIEKAKELGYFEKNE